MQRPLDTFGIARDDGEVGFGRLVRLRTALFPIPQSAERDVVAHGKLLLSQREGAAECLNAWHGTQLPCPRFGEGRVFRSRGRRRLRFPQHFAEPGLESPALLRCRPV